MGEKSKKTRLSFLLNDEEEEVFPRGAPGSSSRDYRFGDRRPADSRSSSLVPPYPTSHRSRAGNSSDLGPGERSVKNSSADKREKGVRKKRQRKFVCETCGFGFYTNSDLQKVS